MPDNFLWLDNFTSNLIARGSDYESVLAEFSKAGINLAALAEQLQDEVAKSFADSWNELRGAIAMKIAAIR